MKPKLKEHQELSDALISFISPDGATQMFNVKNNAVGRLFVRTIRKALNRSRYDVRVRGSLGDRVSLRKAGTYVCDQSVPLKIADRLRVYIQDKQDNVSVRYWMAKYNDRSGAIGMLENKIEKYEEERVNLIGEIHLKSNRIKELMDINKCINQTLEGHDSLQARIPEKTFEIETGESVTVTIQINKK